MFVNLLGFGKNVIILREDLAKISLRKIKGVRNLKIIQGFCSKHKGYNIKIILSNKAIEFTLNKFMKKWNKIHLLNSYIITQHNEVIKMIVSLEVWWKKACQESTGIKLLNSHGINLWKSQLFNSFIITQHNEGRKII